MKKYWEPVMKLLGPFVEFLPKAVVLANLFFISQPILAQRGRIIGTIRDPSEAAIPGASIRATHSGTGLNWEAKSNGYGDYSLEPLPPGLYEVAVTAPNFSPAEFKGIRLTVNATQRVDFKLPLAILAQEVEVGASSRLVETETSEQGVRLSAARQACSRSRAEPGQSVFTLGTFQRQWPAGPLQQHPD
ncbi:MAG: hypothetical protein DMG05_03090 [Acidobacteria bacterium]|nr:MAG: hypothetical protein DMG05_03090 [Acidobacteriota bacterium]